MKIKANIAVSSSGLIFNPDTGESFAVNPIGVEMIQYLKEGHTKEDIEAQVLLRYNIDKPSFEKDFEDFTAFLQSYSLVENE